MVRKLEILLLFLTYDFLQFYGHIEGMKSLVTFQGADFDFVGMVLKKMEQALTEWKQNPTGACCCYLIVQLYSLALHFPMLLSVDLITVG